MMKRKISEKDTVDKTKLEHHFCVTIDDETLEHGTVTVRHRDTMLQEKIHLNDLKAYILDRVTL